MTQSTLAAEKVLYSAKKDPEIVAMPEGRYLTFTGQGAPGGDAFRQAVGALYSVAYTLKFRLKPAGQEFKVGALEGLWWVDGAPERWLTADRAEWHWQLLIRLPDFINEEPFLQARQEALAKKKAPEIGRVELVHLAEGLVAQVMHIGPYETERATIDRLHAFVAEQGYRLRGHHHEIYISDPNRRKPERMKTILRHPVEPNQAS